MSQFEIIYLATVWCVGFLSGISRCLYDRDYESTGHTVSIGMFSGTLAFAIVCLLGGDLCSSDFNPTMHLGIACIVALSGREQTKIISFLWQRILGENLDDIQTNKVRDNTGNSLGNVSNVRKHPTSKTLPGVNPKPDGNNPVKHTLRKRPTNSGITCKAENNE